MLSVCKSCGGSFSNPEHLKDHWEKHHKDRECARCHLPKARPSKNSLFCSTCESDLQRPHKFLSRQEKLEKQILQTSKRAIRWNARLSNLLLLREDLIKNNKYNGSFFSEFCGHGEKRGRCMACNPIFEKITEKSMEEARKRIIEREKQESQKAKIKKTTIQVIEVEIE